MKARPTSYKGIKMLSRLEAGFAQWLDACGFSWAYEPRAFASEHGQYLPDFRIDGLRVVHEPEPVRAYVEIKPQYWLMKDGNLTDNLFEIQTQAKIIWDSEPDSTVLLVSPRSWVFRFVRSYHDLPLFHDGWVYTGANTPPGLALDGPEPWSGAEWWKNNHDRGER